MQEMGMDHYLVTDFLDDKCIPENNPELVLDHTNNPNYINRLTPNNMRLSQP